MLFSVIKFFNSHTTYGIDSLIEIYEYLENVSIDAINLYSIVMPTYSLLITLANLGLPLAISNVIAKSKISSKKGDCYGNV